MIHVSGSSVAVAGCRNHCGSEVFQRVLNACNRDGTDCHRQHAIELVTVRQAGNAAAAR
jgi:hypothetical protein